MLHALKYVFYSIAFLTSISYVYSQTSDSISSSSTVIKISRLLDSADIKSANRLLRRYLKKNPESVMALKQQARLYKMMQKPQKALETWNTIGFLKPDDYDRIKNTAVLLYDLNEYKRCLLVIDSACKIAENEHVKDAEVYYYRALFNRKNKNLHHILLDCEMAETIDSNFIPSHILKAEIRFERMQYDLCVAEYDIALKLMAQSDTNFTILKNRAKALFEYGNAARAALDWTLYLRKYPQDIEARISRAASYIRCGQFNSAISDLNLASQQNPENSVIYDYRGTAKAEMGQFKEGLKDLDYAIKLKFNYAPHYVNRAAIKLALKQPHEACEDLEKAEQLGSNIAYKYIQRYCQAQGLVK